MIKIYQKIINILIFIGIFCCLFQGTTTLWLKQFPTWGQNLIFLIVIYIICFIASVHVAGIYYKWIEKN